MVVNNIDDLLKYTVNNNGCLEWTRCLNSDGYPRAVVNGDHNVKVHRLVMQLYLGEDISGKVVRHTCDNPKCINPDHLLLGSNLDNIKDRVERGRCHKKITKEIVYAVKKLSESGVLTNNQISEIVNIDPRRVSDILLNKRDSNGKIIVR